MHTMLSKIVSGFSRLSLAMFLMGITAGGLLAGNVEITQRKFLFAMNTGIPSTMETQVIDPNYSAILGGTAGFSDKRSVGYVQLGVNPDTRWCYDTLYRRITVSFSITYKRIVGGVATTYTDLQTLEVSFDAVNRQVYTEKARIVYDNSVYDIKAVVGTVTMYDRAGTSVFSGTGFSSLPQDLYWEVGLQAERYYNFTYSSYPASIQVLYLSASDEIQFKWNAMTGAEYYEVEYLYVNNYSNTNLSTTLTTSQLYLTFRNNASRMRTSSTSINIPNVFDRGYVVARVRGIGIGGSNFDKEIPGTWSIENTYTAPYLLNTIASNNYLLVSRHEGGTGNNKNWKLSVSFAEDGKHKEVVEYADGSSRVRQTVTKLSSTQQAIVGETMYDYQGRPTVQVLPVPVANATIKYYENFNKENGSGNKLSREHFDDDDVFTEGCIPNPPLLSTTSGASYYYSPTNAVQTSQQAFVPDAEKYPYTQVVYTPDNTGRIKTQSGVGLTHVLGSGHETKYYYGKPFQEELDRLFGTNVGYRSHYQKNMVVDANGQVSISYLDMSGKTIATALAGLPPASMNPLKTDQESPVDLYTSVAETLTVDLLGDVTPGAPNGEDNHLSPDGTVWSSTTPLLVETETNYNFTYSANLIDYFNECLGQVCFDCRYDLEIDILDECNESKIGGPYIVHLGGTTIDTNCNVSNSYTLNSGTLSALSQVLPIGNYTVQKTLRLNQDAIRQYTELYIQENNCLKKRDDFYQAPDTSGCFYTCEDCLEALGTLSEFTTLYASQYPSLTTDEIELLYLDKKAQCDKICDDASNNACLAGLHQLRRDMTPLGQYATTDDTDLLSIFTSSNQLPNYVGNTGSNYGRQDEPWRHPYFYDKNNNNAYGLPISTPSTSLMYYFEENGQKSKIYLDLDALGNYIPEILPTATVMTETDGRKYIYPQDLRDEEDFISRFQPNWANSLLLYHPEFPFLQKCIDYSDEDVTIGSTTYNDMWEYEKYLKDFDVTNSSQVSALFPTSTDLQNFDLRSKDPFFINFGSSDVVPSLSVNTFYTPLVNNYVIFPAETLSIWEAAYITERCPVTIPTFDPTTNSCVGVSPGLNNTNKSLYITTDADWDRLVGEYLAIKQKLFYTKIVVDLMISTPSLINQCIGVGDYGGALIGSYDHLPCDPDNYALYENKEIRFGNPDAVYNHGPFDPAPPTAEQLLAYGQQQVYEQSGLCPAAMDLQTLLVGMENEGRHTTTSTSFGNEEYLMLKLREKLGNFYSGVVPNNYSVTTVGQVRTITISNGSPTPTPPSITLTLPAATSSASYSWSNLQAFANISNVTGSGPYSFTISAQVLNTVTSAVDWVQVSGSTNIQIGNCASEIPTICAVSQAGKDIRELLDALKRNTVLTSSSLILNPTYSSYLTPAILSYIDAGGTTYQWDYDTGTNIGEIKNLTSGKSIRLTITSGDISFESSFPFVIYTMGPVLQTSPTPTTDNDFVLTTYSSSANAILGYSPTQIFGTMTWFDGTTSFNFPVTECEVPPPAECETPAHQHWFELKEAFDNNTVSSTCADNLTLPDGTPYTLPSSYSLVSLLPDLSYSPDGATSTHFIARIQPLPTPSATVTVLGEYCEPIRACGDCAPTCDEAYILIDLEEATSVLGENVNWFEKSAVFTFNLTSAMTDCYPLLAGTSYTLPASVTNDNAGMAAILTAWAAELNAASDGSYHAYYIATGKLLITLNGLAANGCNCSGEDGSEVTVSAGGDPYTAGTFYNTCCDDGRGILYPPVSGVWQTHTSFELGDPCAPNFTPFPAPTAHTNPCVEALLAAAYFNAENAYQNYLDSVRAVFRSDYIAHCMEVTETFRTTFINSQYHFTLYYYDQAGNLVKTVPPKGVSPISAANLGNVTSARNTSGTYLPTHDQTGATGEPYATQYVYNTLNQPRYQRTPDGGRTEYIYDPLGRLALSQNAKQRAVTKNSYTEYDALGRIKEVGEMAPTAFISQSYALTGNSLATWLGVTATTRAQITKTTYNTSASGVSGVSQQNLRNRVSYSTYQDTYSGSVRTGTYYSYDVHGNVKTLWQQNTDVPLSTHQVKRMDYTYDLVSGKVNTATYQSGAQDQWIHRYSYDADNRITLVETSRDNVFYDRDAAYFYYLHGPLARVEIGHNSIQGVDYANTLHGWLKGVNATNLDRSMDMGKDGAGGVGNPHPFFAKDAYSFALHYYTGDYKNISNNTAFIGNVNAITTSNPGYKNLYNGNIAMMQTSIYDSTSAVDAMLSMYRYDQLNRLTTATYTQAGALTLNTNTWANSFATRYANTFTYDPNGNIKSQLRNGKVGLENMDNLSYKYYAGTNQLEWVDDSGTPANYTDDLEDQSAGNYTYDLIGNLKTDAAEQIQLIDWTVYGKVKSVTRTGGSTKDNLEFTYGPTGQRLTKKVTKNGGTVETYFYFYDASGNLMSLYKHTSTASSDLYIEEQMMYGSSRLGSVQLQEKFVTPPSTVVYTQKRGQKRYELNNHLGNVLTVVSDRKKYNCTTDNYDPDIINTWDYSPFGAILPGRHVGKKKCVVYTINTRFTVFTDNFSVNSTLTTTPSSTNFYLLNSSTTGSVNSGVLKIAGTGNPRGVVKQISVTNGKTYRITFKHYLNTCTTTGITYTYRIYNATSGGTLLASYNFTPGASWQTIDNTAAFTATSTGTYRIEIIRSGNTTNCEFQIDDFTVTYNDNVNHTVCITQGEYRFGFNGQEKDNEVYGESNEYDFGARIYDPRLGRWLACDPLADKYPYWSPYLFAANTPIQAYDPDGRLVIFVNGFRKKDYEKWKTRFFLRGEDYAPWNTEPLYLREDIRNYWKYVDNFLISRVKDNNVLYMDGMYRPHSTAQDRYNRGLEDAKALIEQIESGEVELKQGETIKLVGHSHGGWHSIGMADYLASQGYKVEIVYVKNPHQPNGIVQRIVPINSYELIQYSTKSDHVSSDQTKLDKFLGVPVGDWLVGDSQFATIPGAKLQELPQIPEDDLGGHDVEDQIGDIIKLTPEDPGYVKPRQDTPK